MTRPRQPEVVREVAVLPESVTTLDELMRAAAQRRSVTVPIGCGFRPAAFVIGLPARIVHAMIKECMSIYTPKQKTNV